MLGIGNRRATDSLLFLFLCEAIRFRRPLRKDMPLRLQRVHQLVYRVDCTSCYRTTLIQKDYALISDELSVEAGLGGDTDHQVSRSRTHS